MRKAVLRETSEITSKRVGFLEAGETVAVTAVDGYRLKILRLKWGAHPWKQPGTGWVSERDQEGEGEVLLERLPRSEWSATAQHETALAEILADVSSLRPGWHFNAASQSWGSRGAAAAAAPKKSRSGSKSRRSGARPDKGAA